jgi:hypothetical protein
MNFDDFLIKSFAANPDKLEEFLNRQVVIRDLFKAKGEEVSWVLDLSHILFIIKNFKTGAHFKINKQTMMDAVDFTHKYEELNYETKQFKDFLK